MFSVERAHSSPAIIVNGRHSRFVPVRFAEHAPLQDGCHNIVTILENICLNHEVFADHAFDRIATAIHERLQGSL